MLVVGSAKGGVGASALTVMCGVKLAQQGRRVLLLDGSQNLGNLHVLLNVSPRGSLHGVLTGAAQPQSLVQSVTNNLWLLPADSGDEAMYALNATDRARLHYQLSTLYDGFDVVIVDAGPGLESVVRASAMGASRLLVVLTHQDRRLPTPTIADLCDRQPDARCGRGTGRLRATGGAVCRLSPEGARLPRMCSGRPKLALHHSTVGRVGRAGYCRPCF